MSPNKHFLLRCLHSLSLHLTDWNACVHIFLGIQKSVNYVRVSFHHIVLVVKQIYIFMAALMLIIEKLELIYVAQQSFLFIIELYLYWEKEFFILYFAIPFLLFNLSIWRSASIEGWLWFKNTFSCRCLYSLIRILFLRICEDNLLK